MARATILALLLLAAAACAQASRELLQSGNANCPTGCDIAGGGCVRDTTTGGYRCIRCEGSLIVLRVSGRCGCARGSYASADDTCTACARGSYCSGGEYTESGGSSWTPVQVSCGTGATTLGTRAVSQQQCVNAAGYSWNPATYEAAACSGNTYSTGLRKQLLCTPCPPGMVVVGSDRTSASACVLPAGYFLKSPGQVAPCPMGEYKAGNAMATSCSRCPTGVTTEDIASTSSAACTVLLPGYYALTASGAEVQTAQLCLQMSWCPGGTLAAITGAQSSAVAGRVPCAHSMWTRSFGATNIAECMVPPGYSLVANALAGTNIAPCSSGSYRANWVPYSSSSGVACTSCGTGFGSDAVDTLAVFTSTNTVDTPEPVRASLGACFVLQGQGIYQSATGFRAIDCPGNSYGVAGKTYGVSAMPCRDCPSGMETRDTTPSSNFKAANGWYDPRACVTQAGFGYNGRVATECQVGSWSAGNGYTTCTLCGYGLTTAARGADESSDCVVAAGFGTYDSVLRPCPVGTYSIQGQAAECTDCSTGLTTASEQSDSAAACNVCEPGYGEANCGTQCPSGTYSTGGGALGTACATCPSMTGGGFTFDHNQSTNDYAAAAVSKLGSTTPGDCLAEFGQVVDAVGFIKASTEPTAAASDDLDDCISLCGADCMYITYSYTAATTENCFVHLADASNTNKVGFKAVPSGNVVATSVKKQALASGRYTFWEKAENYFDAALVVANVANTEALCAEACDADPQCVAISMSNATTCKLIRADVTPDTFKRSLAKADVDQQTLATAGTA